MEWVKKHVDTVLVLGGILGAVLWMNGKFNQVNDKFYEVNEKFGKIEKELAVIKTVLIMKGILPSELASNKEVNR